RLRKKLLGFIFQHNSIVPFEKDSDGVSRRPQFRGKMAVGSVSLLFVRSSHLLSGSRCGGSFSCPCFSCRTVLTRWWTAMSCFTSCQSSLACAAATSLSAWNLVHSACQVFMGKGSPYPASLRLAR